jgi:drug/metabolite transporter (DMT)-like permease
MRKPVDGTATAIMVGLCLIWGFQQVAIKAVADDMSPTLQIALRSGGGAILVWLFSRLIARDHWLPGVAFRSGLVVAVLFAIEFLLIAEGLRRTNASHMAVFLYTAPIFAAIGLHLRLPDERLGWLQWLGIGLAFTGIAITFLAPGSGDGGGADLPDMVWGDLMGVGAGAGWGLTTVAVRVSRLSEAPAAQTLFYQLVGAFVILLPFVFLTGQASIHGTALAWASLGFQTVIVAFASYLIWFWLLRRYLAARLGVLSFMTPLFGVVMGVVLLQERLEPAFIIGAVLVLTGLLIVNGQPWLRQWLSPRQAP